MPYIFEANPACGKPPNPLSCPSSPSPPLAHHSHLPPQAHKFDLDTTMARTDTKPKRATKTAAAKPAAKPASKSSKPSSKGAAKPTGTHPSWKDMIKVRCQPDSRRHWCSCGPRNVSSLTPMKLGPVSPAQLSRRYCTFVRCHPRCLTNLATPSSSKRNTSSR